jgi:hypothetical protein
MTGVTALITAEEANRIAKQKPVSIAQLCRAHSELTERVFQGEIKKLIMELDPSVGRETMESCVEKSDLIKLYR